MNHFGGVYRGSRVLIFGHTGFKGSWLSAWLSMEGAELRGYADRTLDPPNHFELAGFDDRIKWTKADVRDYDTVEKTIREFEPDFIFHLAAQAIVKRGHTEPRETFEVNVMGTINILEALRQVNRRCCAVIVTSDKCYHNQEWPWGYREEDRLARSDPYSTSKAGAEIAVASYHHSFFSDADCPVRVATGRAGNVIGGGDWAADRIVPDAVRAWSQKEAIRIRAPRSTRPWQHVLEPLSGYLRLGQCLHEGADGTIGEGFNFGPRATESFDVEALLRQLLVNWPQKGEPIQIDEAPGFHEHGLLKLNCDKALSVLKWQPTLDFFGGVEMTAEWYREFHEQDSAAQDLSERHIRAYVEEAQRQKMPWTNSTV